MTTATWKHVHMIGIGGINMSAVAKLLKHAGISVGGSDLAKSEITDDLEKRGIPVKIGEDKEFMPAETDLVVYTSACPEANAERAEARHRNIRQITNFQFLGEWTTGQRTVLVTGTHGKSTTTAMLGLMLMEAGKNPTVIVGSKVPSFPDGNISLGKGDLFVIEGDEYARHFLEFKPHALILNNIELDHTDVFPDLASMIQAFRELLDRVQDRGFIVANADDPNISTLLGEERAKLEARGIRIRTFGFGSHTDLQVMDVLVRPGEQAFMLRNEQELASRYVLHVPGRMNVMNATAAISMGIGLNASIEAMQKVIGAYHGIWRRFQKVVDKDGVLVISDYGHHPTAVRVNLDAAKSFYPGRRIVLCFQPHHRNRTKHLFLDFVPSFDKADVLILAEIFDVAGREVKADEDVSSRDLQEAILHHDADRTVMRPVEYASTPDDALILLKRWRKPGDVIIVMGAGDIYKIAPHVME